jgi:DNA polymerase III alpha subunit
MEAKDSRVTIPFTYRIICPNGKHYYGVRYTRGCNSADLWTTYFTSKEIKKLLEIFEKRVLRRLVGNDKWLNKHVNDVKFKNLGHTKETKSKISEFLLGNKQSNETIEKRVSKNTGKVRSDEFKEWCREYNKTFWKGKERVARNKGKLHCKETKQKNEKCMETKEDSRIKRNEYGQAILSSNNLKELLLRGKNIGHLNVVFDDEIELFKKYQSDLLDYHVTFLGEPEANLSLKDFHEKCADEWIFPESYQQIDVRVWLLDKCKTQEQMDRVEDEYKLYEEKNLIMLLRLFIFLIDFMRENKFVWGVGRGSSVSSYILYLIGVHRVDSLRYNLDIRDYLK